MIVASKILTVSYGTFSCTLEGFDEPFNTMKAIAEYFRDLAADDRYFGAEPPVPDAAMLHRIAEREIQRRVEAKIQDNGNGVTLRVEDAATHGTEPVAAAPAPQPAAAPAPQPAPVAETAPAPRPVLMPEAAPSVESAAARLSRLRAEALVRPAPAPMPAVFDAYEEDDAPFIGSAPAFAAAPPVQAQPIAVAPAIDDAELAAEPETVAAETLGSADPLGTRADEAALGDVIEAEAEQLLFEPDAETAASEQVLLDTIAGLSFETAAPAAPAPHAAEAYPSLMETLSGLLSDAEPTVVEAAPQAEAETEAVIEAVAEPEVMADIESDSAIEAAPEALPAAEDQPAPEQSAEAPVVAEDTPSEKLQRARARVIRVRRVEPTRPVRKPAETVASPVAEPAAEEEAEPVGEPMVLAAPMDLEAIAAPPALPVEEVELSAEAEAQLAAELAALEQEAAPQGAELAPVHDKLDFSDLNDDDFDADILPAEAADLPPADSMDDADLALGLAAEAEDDPELIDARATTEVAAEAATEQAVSEAAVSRLIEQTNTALEVPETKRRRSAIEHLKAAVRATLAERKVNPRGDEAQVQERTDAYRRDLTRVVGPVSSDAVAAPQRSGDKPPPLVLVSAQRIDRRTDAPAPVLTPVENSAPHPVQSQNTLPVRPRRVSSSALAVDTIMSGFDEDDAVAQPSGGNIFDDAARLPFPDFIEKIGATALPELLEAAAAYNAVMLDRPEFPRQTLFKQLEVLGAADQPSREDGLRSFGKLLREGRIVKTQRGQFGLPQESAALTEAKRLIG